MRSTAMFGAGDVRIETVLVASRQSHVVPGAVFRLILPDRAFDGKHPNSMDALVASPGTRIRPRLHGRRKPGPRRIPEGEALSSLLTSIYQSRTTPYWSNTASLETTVRFSAWACAINIRSNGSLCGPGRFPARCPCSTVILSPVNPWSARCSPNSCAMNSAPCNLPSRAFVATSHADAALTYISLASSAMAAREREVMRLSPASHQRKACVSRSKRIVHR